MRVSLLRSKAAGFSALACAAIWPALSFAAPEQTPAAENDGRHDFDFFIGSWHMANRLLKPGTADEWVEFTTTTTDRSFIDGLGNTDEMTLPKGHHGISLRFFDPGKKEWSIYWAKSPTGILEMPPVVGHFEKGEGNFYSDDRDEAGKPVKIRYNWTHPTVDEAHWNLAHSYDGGKTWTVTWTMVFTRIK
jgi:hypothetical protein